MTWRPDRVVLVPGVLALLPEYAGSADPVAPLRAACLEAVAWLGEVGDGFGVHGSHQGLRLARHLAAEAGVRLDLESEHPRGLLVVANGSATRSEKAPGHLDERAHGFDDDLRRRLLEDPASLGGLDLALAAELWADVDSLVFLGSEVDFEPTSVVVDYDDDPYGVQYWVLRWTTTDSDTDHHQED